MSFSYDLLTEALLSTYDNLPESAKGIIMIYVVMCELNEGIEVDPDNLPPLQERLIRVWKMKNDFVQTVIPFFNAVDEFIDNSYL